SAARQALEKGKNSSGPDGADEASWSSARRLQPETRSETLERLSASLMRRAEAPQPGGAEGASPFATDAERKHLRDASPSVRRSSHGTTSYGDKRESEATGRGQTRRTAAERPGAWGWQTNRAQCLSGGLGTGPWDPGTRDVAQASTSRRDLPFGVLKDKGMWKLRTEETGMGTEVPLAPRACCGRTEWADQLDSLSVTAIQDPEGFLGHPVNAFKLMKRLNTEWGDLENLVLSDTTKASNVNVLHYGYITALNFHCFALNLPCSPTANHCQQ
ncbi:hypothetical protein CRUP_010783, partial [Coryphaenoides rupestris]